MECWRFIIWPRLCEKIRLTANVILLQPLPAHGGWPLSVSTSLAQISSLYPRGPFSGSRQATLAKTELLQALHIQPISFTKKPSLKRSSCFFVFLICWVFQSSLPLSSHRSRHSGLDESEHLHVRNSQRRAHLVRFYWRVTVGFFNMPGVTLSDPGVVKRRQEL